MGYQTSYMFSRPPVSFRRSECSGSAGNTRIANCGSKKKKQKCCKMERLVSKTHSAVGLRKICEKEDMVHVTITVRILQYYDVHHSKNPGDPAALCIIRTAV